MENNIKWFKEWIMTASILYHYYYNKNKDKKNNNTNKPNKPKEGYLPKAGEIAKNATFSKASTVEIYNQDDLTWNPTQNEVTVETVTG